MKRVILILFLSFFPFVEIFAVSFIARFVFITEPRTVRPGVISDEIKIQAQDAGSIEIKTGETIDLEFSSNSLSGEFLNSSGNPVSTVMAKNTANRTFYYRDSTHGIYDLTVKAIGRESGKSWSASQSITISDFAGSPPESSGENPPPTPPPSPSIATAGADFTISDKKIQAYAGEDRTVVAGSNAEFSGSAAGIDGKPLINARFWWNFGSGETKEGKTVNYTFLIPGRYMVGLHVSSGEYSASDYVAVEVVPNQFSVSGVLIGELGFVKIENEGSVAVDIGGWILEDAAGKSFIIPLRTVISSKSEIVFANRITGILFTGPARLLMRYPNLSLAFVWEEKVKVVAASNELPEVLTKVFESAPSTKVSRKSGVVSAENKNTDSGEFAAKPLTQNDLSQTASASHGASVPTVLFFAAAAALGLIAAVGFLFVRRG